MVTDGVLAEGEALALLAMFSCSVSDAGDECFADSLEIVDESADVGIDVNCGEEYDVTDMSASLESLCCTVGNDAGGLFPQ